MKLFVGLGRIEMSTWMSWWQEQLEATIAANVAGAYAGGVHARMVIWLRLGACRTFS
jgi:hypothetical protein